jgi:hypothetical protein
MLPIVIGAQSPFQHSDTETYSDDILGPVWFSLTNLRVSGTNANPAAPAQSKYIISEDEKYTVSVDIEFNKTPLSSLLMCLGTRLTVDFAFEGFGKAATEVDLTESILTTKGVYKYTVTYVGIPMKDGLTSGLYEIAAVADIGPVENKCQTPVFGHGYIAEVLLEVYPKGEELP